MLDADEISLIIETDIGSLLPTVVADNEAFALNDCRPYLLVGERFVAAVTDVEAHDCESFWVVTVPI